MPVPAEWPIENAEPEGNLLPGGNSAMSPLLMFLEEHRSTRSWQNAKVMGQHVNDSIGMLLARSS